MTIPGSLYPVSTIRRKPKVTYRSPSAEGPAELRIEGPVEVSRLVSKKVTPPSSSGSSSSSPPPSNTGRKWTSTANTRKANAMGPWLPLYHPLGQLALSLPDLDPTTFGLPATLEGGRRSSVRARRPAAKLREEGDVAKNGKKKRLNGKRRRDDGDGTYTAKRVVVTVVVDEQ